MDIGPRGLAVVSGAGVCFCVGGVCRRDGSVVFALSPSLFSAAEAGSGQ